MLVKVVAQNRRARFDYEILETVEAGVVLTGPETKSCRAGHVSLAGAYVSFHGDTPRLKNAMIAKYAYSAPEGHEEKRDRTLLLRKNELAKLQRAVEEKGIALIPLEVRAGKHVKILLGLGRGRKRMDKRQHIKERETSRRVREGREV